MSEGVSKTAKSVVEIIPHSTDVDTSPLIRDGGELRLPKVDFVSKSFKLKEWEYVDIPFVLSDKSFMKVIESFSHSKTKEIVVWARTAFLDWNKKWRVVKIKMNRESILSHLFMDPASDEYLGCSLISFRLWKEKNGSPSYKFTYKDATWVLKDIRVEKQSSLDSDRKRVVTWFMVIDDSKKKKKR